MVFSILGIITFSIALTRLFVTLMTSSRMTKAVYHGTSVGKEQSYLKRGEFNQNLDGFLVSIFTLLNLLSTSSQSSQFKGYSKSGDGI